MEEADSQLEGGRPEEDSVQDHHALPIAVAVAKALPHIYNSR